MELYREFFITCPYCGHKMRYTTNEITEDVVVRGCDKCGGSFETNLAIKVTPMVIAVGAIPPKYRKAMADKRAKKAHKSRSAPKKKK